MTLLTKAHSGGFDIVIVERDRSVSDPWNQVAVALCDRRGPVGCSGLVVWERRDDRVLVDYYTPEGDVQTAPGVAVRCLVRTFAPHDALNVWSNGRHFEIPSSNSVYPETSSTYLAREWPAAANSLSGTRCDLVVRGINGAVVWRQTDLPDLRPSAAELNNHLAHAGRRLLVIAHAVGSGSPAAILAAYGPDGSLIPFSDEAAAAVRISLDLNGTYQEADSLEIAQRGGSSFLTLQSGDDWQAVVHTGPSTIVFETSVDLNVLNGKRPVMYELAAKLDEISAYSVYEAAHTARLTEMHATFPAD